MFGTWLNFSFNSKSSWKSIISVCRLVLLKPKTVVAPLLHLLLGCKEKQLLKIWTYILDFFWNYINNFVVDIKFVYQKFKTTPWIRVHIKNVCGPLVGDPWSTAYTKHRCSLYDRDNAFTFTCELYTHNTYKVFTNDKVSFISDFFFWGVLLLKLDGPIYRFALPTKIYNMFWRYSRSTDKLV